MRVVVALGGNALLRKGEEGSFEAQMRNAVLTAIQLADMIERGYEVVITHGNGPQVGALLLQQEVAQSKVPPMPLHACGAMTQGLIGYMIQQALGNELRRRGLDKVVVTVVTQVEVSLEDEAFKNPTKYVGPYYSEEEAARLSRERGWVMRRDPRGGWRRVVPSPDPIRIVEIEAIRSLVERGFIVIASGGGGIPVASVNGLLEGVDAVIDKDLAAQILATELSADVLLMLTDVDYVMLDYGTPRQRPIRRMSVEEARRYLEEGQFPPGSMGPKVLAGIRFVEAGGRLAAIGHLYRALEVLEGSSGTWIVRE